MYVLAQRNRRKFIEARSINYQRRTFRDRNREPRSISTRNFSTIRLTRIVEKRRIANRRLKSDTRRLFLFHRTTEVRLLGDAEGRRSFLVSRRVSRGQEEGEEGGEENGRGPVRHSWLRHGGNPPRRTLRTSLKLFGVSKLASVSPPSTRATRRETWDERIIAISTLRLSNF